jgi:hypothetical protein
MNFKAYFKPIKIFNNCSIFIELCYPSSAWARSTISFLAYIN